MPLLFALGVIASAPQPASGIVDSANRSAAMACESALAARTRGELQSISVDSARRTGPHTILTGKIEVFLSPDPAPPGELSPAHIINEKLRYQCRLFGSNVVKTTVRHMSN